MFGTRCLLHLGPMKEMMDREVRSIYSSKKTMGEVFVSRVHSLGPFVFSLLIYYIL